MNRLSSTAQKETTYFESFSTAFFKAIVRIWISRLNYVTEHWSIKKQFIKYIQPSQTTDTGYEKCIMQSFSGLFTLFFFFFKKKKQISRAL